MKKVFLFAITGIALLTSCNRDIDLYEGPQKVSDAEIKAHMESIFGTSFSPDQDWNMTASGKVTMTINTPEVKDVVKVQILTTPPFGSNDCNGALVLNQTEVKYGETVTLYYDAPKSLTKLYATCVMKDGQQFIQSFNIGDEKLVFEPTATSAKARQTRALEQEGLDAKLQAIENSGILKLYSQEESYNNIYKDKYPNNAKLAGWDEDYLYAINPANETSMFVDLDPYTSTYTETLRDAFNAYLPNKVNNLSKVRNSGFSTYQNYPLTTGEDPVVMAPVFKDDGKYMEITYCDLYYYYFKEEWLNGKSDAQVAEFLKKLPKFKAIDLKYAVLNSGESYKGIGLNDERELKRFMGFGIVYWGDFNDDNGFVPATGENGVTGTFNFPQGYKIGFMTRSRDYEKQIQKDGDLRQGELYGDDRLNAYINTHGHFKSSKLGDNDPRMAWFWCNNLAYLMCETGSDSDFNDMVYQVMGGVLPPPPNDPKLAEYVFCFEDREIGDYDLNDVVLKFRRIDATNIEWSVLACGANDELYIENIDGDIINDHTEVHKILGSDERVFINTEKGKPYHQPVVEAFTVNENYSILNPTYQPNIYDKTINKRVFLSKRGEDPHAIMIPSALPKEVLQTYYETMNISGFNENYTHFLYPLERVCVMNAYDGFNTWGASNSILSTTWYMHPNMDKVYVEP
ncbi:MAG: hypothetical protein K6G32_10860 [Prevotella sp.]|nr:hypothetical protein [Prevotella sp.]